MKKTIIKLTNSLILLMAVLAMTGCNSDGDETIALEYGKPHKMIVGEWVVGTGPRVWIFTDDGYYTDSKDNGEKRHTWRLDSNSQEDEPYYGGIYLDGVYYDILLLSDGLWRLKNGNTLLELSHGGTGNDADNEDQNSESNHNAGGSGKLASTITISSASTRSTSEYQTIKFFYDSNNRVKAVEYGGTDEIVIGPQGYHLDYNISGTTMTLSGYDLRNSSVRMTSPGKGTVNSQGYLEMEYFETNESEIKKNDYLIDYYEHNSKNQVTKMRVVESDTNKDFRVYTYKWENDCITSVTGNPGGAGYSTFRYSNIENKCNINLNRMLYAQMYSEDIFALALCGYICAKEKYLIRGDWKLDSNGYPISITHNGYTYNISYTK